MLPPKCSITDTEILSSHPLLASIRHATGSKVRTATSSTFTLKKASLQFRSAATGFGFVEGTARTETEECLTFMQT